MARGKAPTFELQRSTILATAARLFAEKGYPTASMAELAAACGVSKSLLYHYYRDKDHLLFDIGNTYIDTLQSIVDAVAALALDPEAHLRELVVRFMEEYEHSSAQHVVLVQDLKFLPPDLREEVMAKQRDVVAGFAQVVHELRPELPPESLLTPVTMILFGMINWTFTWLKPNGHLTYANMAPLVADVFLGGVQSLSAGPVPASPKKRKRTPEETP